MKVKISEIKRESLQIINGNWNNLIWGSLVYLSIKFGGESINKLIFKNNLGIIIWILLIPLTFGFIKFYTDFMDKALIEISTIFWVYKNIFAKSVLLHLFVVAKSLIWGLLFVAPGVVKFISYSFAPFILLENPDMIISDVMNQSQKITYGYKKFILLFHLSFVGWYILSFLTLGLGLLWLLPYHYISHIILYRNLSTSETKKIIYES